MTDAVPPAEPPLPPSEEPPPMEIHKPKPVHGWREFFKEYAIIVLGVLTALAAEQAVEFLRHYAEVRDMTQKLQEESQTNADVLAYDISSAQAAVAGLDRAINVLSKNGPVAAPAPLPPDPVTFGLGDTAWQAIQYSALLPIMPKPLIANYWKIQYTSVAFSARSQDFHAAYRQAEAAMRIFAGAAPTQAMRENLLLRLADAAQTGQSYIHLAQSFRIIIQWALDGKEINLGLSRQLSPQNPR
jgi:hypothetical protein